MILRLCFSNVFLRIVKIIITRPFGELPLGPRLQEIVNRFPKEPSEHWEFIQGGPGFST